MSAPRDPRGEVLGAALALLDYVDGLDTDDAGAVLVGPGGASGAILVDGRRVCWAVAPGLGRRLTDLLRARARPEIPADAIEAVVRDCRSTGEPIGQALVARGLIDDAALEHTLLRHTAESLVEIARGGRGAAWAPRATGFSPRHRFSTARLAAASARAALDLDEPDLDTLATHRAGAAEFARVPGLGGVAPVGVIGLDHVDARTLVELGKWAVGELDVAAAVDRARRMVVVGDGQTSAVAWPHGARVRVALCPSPQILSRVVSHLHRPARPEPSGG